MTVYTSRVLIKDFLDELIADMGLYQQRDRAFYRDRMNEALSFLYKAVIRWQAEGEGVPQGGRLSCAAITSSFGTALQGPDVLAAKLLAGYNAGLADFYDYLAVRQKGR